MSTAETMAENWRQSATWNPWKLYLMFRRAKIVTVEPVVFLYMFALSLSLSFTEQYYLNRFGEDKLRNSNFSWPNHSFCVNSTGLDFYANASNAVQAESSHLVMYGQVPNTILSVLATLLVGPLSDRIGRKPFIYVVSLGATLGGLATLGIMHYRLDMYYFILVNVITGFTGGYASVLSLCIAYVTDASSLKWLTIRIGIIEGTLYAGGALGQWIAGEWLAAVHCFFEPVTWLYTGAMATISVYTLIFLPESTTREERTEKARRRPRGCVALLQGFRLYFCSKWPIGWRLWAALIAFCVVVINLAGNLQIIILFLRNHPLDWGPKMVGDYQAMTMIIHMVCLLVVLPILVALRLPDPLIAIIGLAFSAGTKVFTGFVRTTWQMLIVGVFSAPEAVMPPVLRSISSKLVTPEDQGALYSFIASCEVVATAVSSVLYGMVYPATLEDGMSSGTAYLLMAILCIIPAPLMVILLVFRKLPNHALGLTVLEKPSLVAQATVDPAHYPTETDRLLPASSYPTINDTG